MKHMGLFSSLFGPSDEELVEYIERYEELGRDENQTDEDVFVREGIKEKLEQHGWHQEKRWGHVVWNKDN